jgi:hypothetical protein
MCGDEPYTFVVAANLHRRHLTAEQKRDLIDKLLKATPEKSDRQIADAIKASPTTVGKRRKTLEDTGDVSTMDTRTDTKGRQQQAHKPPTKDPSISAIADRAEARSRENQRRQAVGNGVDPEASADQRKAEAQAEPPTDDGFDALLAAWCAASDAGQERLMLTVGLTRSKPHLVGEAECLQRTAPSAPVDGDPMPPIPDALEFLRRGAS